MKINHLFFQYFFTFLPRSISFAIVEGELIEFFEFIRVLDFVLNRRQFVSKFVNTITSEI